MSATMLTLAQLVDERHAVHAERHAELIGGGAWQGPFRGPRRGQGLDFDDLRPYAAGDDVRHVDWKTSARRSALHTRLYREEKEHVVTIALDLRASMFTGSTTLRAVAAGRLGARLLWRASAGGSRSAVATFDERGVSLSRAAGGERGALAGCKLIADTFARARREASRTRVGAELQSLLESLLAGGRGLGASIVVSGLDAPGDLFDDALARLAMARPLAVVHVEDPLERQGLPSGRYVWAGAMGPSVVRLGRRERRRLAETLAQRRAALEARIATVAVPLLPAHEGTLGVLRALRERGFLP